MIQRIKSGNTNCYLLRQDNSSKAILIDAGTAADKHFLDHLQAAGSLDSIGLVILTHGHYDHIGYAAALQQQFNIPIAMHRGDMDNVTEGIMGFPPARGFLSRCIRKSTLKKMAGARYPLFTPDIILEHQTTLPDFPQIEVLYLPGHTKGSVGVVFENHLFPGDLVMSLPFPSASWFAEDFETLNDSIRQVLPRAFEMIYPGHGAAFSGKWLKYLA